MGYLELLKTPSFDPEQKSFPINFYVRQVNESFETSSDKTAVEDESDEDGNFEYISQTLTSPLPDSTFEEQDRHIHFGLKQLFHKAGVKYEHVSFKDIFEDAMEK